MAGFASYDAPRAVLLDSGREVPLVQFFVMLLTRPSLCMSGRRHHRRGAETVSLGPVSRP